MARISRGVLPLFDSHMHSFPRPCFRILTFVRRVHSHTFEGGIGAPHFLASEQVGCIRIDRVMLARDIAEAMASGVPAILTIICMATCIAMYIPVKTIGTVKTARMFINRWYPQFGLPAVFRSERGAAFASNLMASVRAILGV